MEKIKMQQYHYPLEEGFTERIHTPGGVRSLVEGSHLMKLLRDLDKDGFNVDGPLAELTAHRCLCRICKHISTIVPNNYENKPGKFKGRKSGLSFRFVLVPARFAPCH